MNALLFLVVAAAMAGALLGRRSLALVLFAAALLGSVAWLNHHITSPLALRF